MDAENMAFEIERKRREEKEAKHAKHKAEKAEASGPKKRKLVGASLSGTRQIRGRRLVDEPDLPQSYADVVPIVGDEFLETQRTPVEHVDLIESPVRGDEVAPQVACVHYPQVPRSSRPFLPSHSHRGQDHEEVESAELRGLDRTQMKLGASYQAQEGAKYLQGAIERLDKHSEFYNAFDCRYGELEVQNQHMLEAHNTALAYLWTEYEGKPKMAMDKASAENTFKLTVEKEKDAAKKKLKDLQAMFPKACEQSVAEFRASEEYKKTFKKGYELARDNSTNEAQSRLDRYVARHGLYICVGLFIAEDSESEQKKESKGDGDNTERK